MPNSEAIAPKSGGRDRHGARRGPPKRERARAQRRWSACTASIPCLRRDGHRQAGPQDTPTPLVVWPLPALYPCRLRLQDGQCRDRSADTPVVKTHPSRSATSFSMISTVSEVIKYRPQVRRPTATSKFCFVTDSSQSPHLARYALTPLRHASEPVQLLRLLELVLTVVANPRVEFALQGSALHDGHARGSCEAKRPSASIGPQRRASQKGPVARSRRVAGERDGQRPDGGAGGSTVGNRRSHRDHLGAGPRAIEGG
jgi:hypothetical protein